MRTCTGSAVPQAPVRCRDYRHLRALVTCGSHSVFRDVEELTAERGLAVDHTTIWRWTHTHAPEVQRRLRGSSSPNDLPGTAVPRRRRWRADADNCSPHVLAMDKLRSYPAAIRELRSEGQLQRCCRHRTRRYGNNRIESDHRHVEQGLRAMQGLRTTATAGAVIAGIKPVQRTT
jgi:transposase, IS6 family